MTDSCSAILGYAAIRMDRTKFDQPEAPVEVIMRMMDKLRQP